MTQEKKVRKCKVFNRNEKREAISQVIEMLRNKGYIRLDHKKISEDFNIPQHTVYRLENCRGIANIHLLALIEKLGSEMCDSQTVNNSTESEGVNK